MCAKGTVPRKTLLAGSTLPVEGQASDLFQWCWEVRPIAYVHYPATLPEDIVLISAKVVCINDPETSSLYFLKCLVFKDFIFLTESVTVEVGAISSIMSSFYSSRNYTTSDSFFDQRHKHRAKHLCFKIFLLHTPS